MWRKKNVHVMHFMYTGNKKSWQNTQFVHLTEVIIRGRPIIGADIKHFTDYRYRPF